MRLKETIQLREGESINSPVRGIIKRVPQAARGYYHIRYKGWYYALQRDDAGYYINIDGLRATFL